MLSTPFNFLSLKNQNFLSDTLKHRQIFAEKVFEETKNLIGENKIQKESEIYPPLEGKNGLSLQSNVFKWLSELNLEERVKLCAIQDKWLTSILIQMYLLFEKNNNIEFEPTDEMEIFFSNSNSLNSSKLSINEFSPNDEIKNSNKRKGEEIEENHIQNNGENEDIYFYKKYFKTLDKETKNEKDLEKEEAQKDFIESVKIISMDGDNELDTIIISSDLLSTLEKFEKFFKFFSIDNYFKEWLYPFKNKNNKFNFYMPAWMRDKNKSFSFCQLIIGFLEQHILLNYEYFYLSNKFYELPCHKKINKIYCKNRYFEDLINKNKTEFKYLISPKIIESLVDKVISDKKFSKINEKIRNMCNKVYLDKYGCLLFDKNSLLKDEICSSIFKELKFYFKKINQGNNIKKIIDILSFLGFKEVIKSRYCFYYKYKKLIIKCLNNQLMKKEDNKAEKLKINKINEINKNYSSKDEDENYADDKLVRNISKTTETTSSSIYSNKDLSIFEDDSSSVNSEVNVVKDKIINKKYTIPFNYNYNNNLIINNSPYQMFAMFCNSYYDKAINDYCLITNNNLRTLNGLYVEKLEKIENIIKDGLKDKFDISFGHYGSFFTGLSIEGSDMDICIYYKPKDNNKIDFYKELYELLKKQKPLLYEITTIDSIEMPLIKLKIDITEEIKNINPLNNSYNYIDYEDLTKIKIDITFDDNKEYLENCEKNVEFIKNEIKNYPQIKPVLLYLKRYFKKMDMNKVYYGGINSFSLFLLVLNVIKSSQKENPNNNIGVGQLLYLVLKKFSSFNFGCQGIGKDSYDYYLQFVNDKRKLHILSPLNGKNVASFRCNSDKVTKTFQNAYNLLVNEINFLKKIVNSGYPVNLFPINSIISHFNSMINFDN